MWQQIIALVIILFFIWRLSLQKKNKKISRNEFRFWLTFWLIAALAILGLKMIDRLVIQLGLSGAGINYLLYIAVLFLFYLLFRTRLKIVKIEKDITQITRDEALK
ncbi:MAG TPA: DUF2304 family protein [bacterium]|nr:DUF2304 family protein [bacterium]HPT29970.1 DUF2304 family protein [bacterium]